MIDFLPEQYLPAVIATAVIVEAIKRADGKERITRFLPLVSIVIGFALGMFLDIFWFEALGIGLMASGLYDTVKKFIFNK